jgi:hypothetical protein
MLIGPQAGNTPCPWCAATGEDRIILRQRWDQGRGTYVTECQVVPCDGCRGAGYVTRAAARAMAGQPQARGEA